MSQKRVATVLASLVGTLTLSAGILLLLEGGGGVASMTRDFAAAQPIQAQLATNVPLRDGHFQYIIVYESGDLAGCSATLADGRVTGGAELPPHTVRPKANFHFVIDSAHSGSNLTDGHLEVGTAWQNQDLQAPNAGWPDSRYYQNTYTNAVGVCLISDLHRAPISAAQHQSLLEVLRDLQSRLHIKSSNIYFQWELEPNVSSASPAQQAYASRVRSELD